MSDWAVHRDKEFVSDISKRIDKYTGNIQDLLLDAMDKYEKHIDITTSTLKNELNGFRRHISAPHPHNESTELLMKNDISAKLYQWCSMREAGQERNAKICPRQQMENAIREENVHDVMTLMGTRLCNA
jgi:hypothetical protein